MNVGKILFTFLLVVFASALALSSVAQSWSPSGSSSTGIAPITPPVAAVEHNDASPSKPLVTIPEKAPQDFTQPKSIPRSNFSGSPSVPDTDDTVIPNLDGPVVIPGSNRQIQPSAGQQDETLPPVTNSNSDTLGISEEVAVEEDVKPASIFVSIARFFTGFFR
jgi:hypothetical protein